MRLRFTAAYGFRNIQNVRVQESHRIDVCHLMSSRKLASASRSPSCFSKVLGGWRETSQLTTPPASLVVGSTPPGTRSVTALARSLVSTLYTSRSGVHFLHAKLYTPHLTRYTPHSTCYTYLLTHFTLHTSHSKFTRHTLHTPHSTLDSLHLTPNVLYMPQFTL